MKVSEVYEGIRALRLSSGSGSVQVRICPIRYYRTGQDRGQEDSGQGTGQRTGDRGQRTESRRQGTEDRR